MADLRAALDELGLENAETILQSGNVRFDSNLSGKRLKELLEQELGKRFEYAAHVQVIEAGTLENIIDRYPFGTKGEDSHDYVVFMERGLERDLAAEEVELAKGERVEAGDGVVYWRVDKGSTLQSQFGKLLTRAKYRDLNTNRNLRTLRKLL
jgi:uncharacterized protein (DUF1697 family)